MKLGGNKMENLHQVVSEIRDNLKQKSSSQKDEIKVMKAMLNDPNYSVGMYDKSGKIGDYCPYEDSRKMMANVIASTTKINSQEAIGLANNYEVTKSDATTMINISKEFTNTYLQTGRKLPLGGRERIDAKLCIKHVDEKEKGVPNKSNTNKRENVIIPAHDAIKASCPCPSWLK